MKKSFIILSALFLVLSFYSCEENSLCPRVAIPETDTTPPQFTLNINGPGIGQTIATHEGWTGGSLKLFAGGAYRFVLSASDQGGTRILRMQIPIDITISQLSPDNATSIDLSLLSKLLELTNNDDEPTSCLIMSGRFTATEDTSLSARIDFFASDYGGIGGSRNSTRRSVGISFTDDLALVEFTDF